MLMDCGSRDRDSSGNPFAWEIRELMTNRDKQKIATDSPVTKIARGKFWLLAVARVIIDNR